VLGDTALELLEEISKAVVVASATTVSPAFYLTAYSVTRVVQAGRQASELALILAAAWHCETPNGWAFGPICLKTIGLDH